MEYNFHYDSPLGGIVLTSDGNALTGLWFDDQTPKTLPAYNGEPTAHTCETPAAYNGEPAAHTCETPVPSCESVPHTREMPVPVFEQTAKWLDIYFRGGIPDFTPPLHLHGTPFRREVWDILRTIPYGRTVSYGDIARQLADRRGIPRMSSQAVGGAVGHNPVSLIVPCHRVIGTGGNLTGYGGGLWRKKELLLLEGSLS